MHAVNLSGDYVYRYILAYTISRVLTELGLWSSPAKNLWRAVDPSAAPPPLLRLARTKSGWRAGAPTKIRLAAAGDFSGGGGGGGGGGGIRRPRERRHIALFVSLSMEHVVSTASVVTVGYFGAHNKNDNNYNFSTASAHVKSLVLSNV